MFYLGIIFFLIGAWQAFMKGRLSPVISGASLILGTIFIFIGNWQAGFFFVYLFTSWFFLMQIYRFSTYHKHFFKVAPLLIGYAVLVAFLLIQFNFQNFFWWYLVLSGIFLMINHKKQHQTKNLLDLLAGDDREKRAEAETSFNKTIKYHLLSSVVFLVSFILAFSYFSNRINL